MELRDRTEVIAEIMDGIRPKKMIVGLGEYEYQSLFLLAIQPDAMMRVKAGTKDHTVTLRKVRSCGTKVAIVSVEIPRVSGEADEMCSY